MLTVFGTGLILDAIESWADGYLLLRETTIAVGEGSRLDGLLIPFRNTASCMMKTGRPYWQRPRLVGVEIKRTREDFRRGLREKQFQRYDAKLGGLYVVTLGDIAATSEIPAGIGHVVVKRFPSTGAPFPICKRHPRFKDHALDTESAWRTLFELAAEWNKARLQKDKRIEYAIAKIGNKGREVIARLLEAEARVNQRAYHERVANLRDRASLAENAGV